MRDSNYLMYLNSESKGIFHYINCNKNSGCKPLKYDISSAQFWRINTVILFLSSVSKMQIFRSIIDTLHT